MAKAGASQYTFHIEATNNVMDCIQRVKAANMKVGEYATLQMFFLDTYIQLVICSTLCTINQAVVMI